MKIKNQLALVIFSLCLILLSAASVIVYSIVKEIVTSQVREHIKSVSEAKSRRLDDIIQKKYEFLDAIASNYLIIKNLKAYSLIPNEIYKEQLKSSLTDIRNLIPSIKKVHLVFPDGKVAASTNSSFTDQSLKTKKNFLKPLLNGRFLEGFSLNEKNELTITMSSIIVSENKIIGIIILETDASDFLSMTLDYTGLGETGETLLAKRERNKTLYLTPLRFDSSAALKKTVDYNDTSQIVNLAVQKNQGLYAGKKDYRNREVIGKVRYFPKIKWGMVTKIDKEEAYKPIHKLEKIILITFLGFTALSFIIAYFTGKLISSPLVSLTESVKRIINGDYTLKVSVRSKNEIGILAGYYNQMLEKQQSYLNMILKSNESLERFAYIISHDLKSPLSAISGLADLLNINTGKEDTGIYINLIIEKTEQMRSLIDGILEFSVKEKKGTVKPLTDVGLLIQQVIKMIDFPPNITIKIPENLPKVRYHKIPLLQVFQNLISNSVKYMDKSQGIINIGCEKTDGFFRFSLNDNGPGIKKENHKRIFELFETVNERPIQNSSGIGLSIVKKIIEENGGEIRVESEPGKGSTFIFTIPDLP